MFAMKPSTLLTFPVFQPETQLQEIGPMCDQCAHQAILLFVSAPKMSGHRHEGRGVARPTPAADIVDDRVAECNEGAHQLRATMSWSGARGQRSMFRQRDAGAARGRAAHLSRLSAHPGRLCQEICCLRRMLRGVPVDPDRRAGVAAEENLCAQLGAAKGVRLRSSQTGGYLFQGFIIIF